MVENRRVPGGSHGSRQTEQHADDGRWRCPTCQVEADVEGLNLHVYVTGQRWPLHNDCEFGKNIDKIVEIDFSKLERVS